MKSQKQAWNKEYKLGKKWNKETLALPRILKNKTVLEIGVGNGKTLQAIIRQKPKRVVALDISREAIDICKKSFPNSINFIEGDITTIKFKEKFDIVVCYYALNNLLEKARKKAISNVYNLTKEGGKILFEDFSVGDFRQEKEKAKIIEPNTLEKKNGIICHFFTKEELKDLFRQFTKVKLELKESHPIKNKPNLKRRIISGIIEK